MNKVDLVSNEEKKVVTDKVRGINKFAEIIETERSAVNVERILGGKCCRRASIVTIAFP